MYRLVSSLSPYQTASSRRSVLDFAHYWFSAQWLVHRWAQKIFVKWVLKSRSWAGFYSLMWMCAYVSVCTWLHVCEWMSVFLHVFPAVLKVLVLSSTCTGNSATQPQPHQLEWRYGDSLEPLHFSPFPKPPGLSTVIPTDPQDQSRGHWVHELTNEHGKWWLIEENK